MGYQIVRFPYDGTIDADGHVLESPTLWERYLEEKYRARALRIRVDDEGLEYLEIDGKPSVRTRGGSLGLLGAMGDPGARPAPERPTRTRCRSAPAMRASGWCSSTVRTSCSRSSIRRSDCAGSASSRIRS